MKYVKPQLNGSSAISAIQSIQDKQTSPNEPLNRPTSPAYEADE